MDSMKIATPDRVSVLRVAWTTSLLSLVVLLSVFTLSIGFDGGLFGTLAVFATAMSTAIVVALAVVSTLEVLLTSERYERSTKIFASFRAASITGALASAISAPTLFVALRDDQLAGFSGPYFMGVSSLLIVCATGVAYFFARRRARIT